MSSSANIFKRGAVSAVEGTVEIPDIQPEISENKTHKSVSFFKVGHDNENEVLLTKEEVSVVELQAEAQEADEDGFVPFVPSEVVEIIEPKPLELDEIKEMYKDELDEMRQQVEQEAYVEAYEVAYQKAYSDAFSRKKGELEQILNDVDSTLLGMQKNQKEFMENYAEELKFFAVDIAQKFIMDKIDEHELVLHKLVMQTVESVKNSAWLEIELSQRLEKLIDSVKEELKKGSLQGRISVSPKAGPEDMIRVNSEKGTIVADISRQAENLKDLFKST